MTPNSSIIQLRKFCSVRSWAIASLFVSGVIVLSGAPLSATAVSSRVEPVSGDLHHKDAHEPAAEATPDAGLVVMASPYSVEETADRFEALLIERGVTVFTRVDHAAGAAGVPPQRSGSYYRKVYTYKLIKALLSLPPFFLYKEQLLEAWRGRSGSADYQQASPVMRGTLVKVVNEDLRDLLPLVPTPALLIWGEDDTATPLSDGQLMEQQMPHARLLTLPNADHYAFLRQAEAFLQAADAFLTEEPAA